MERDRVRELGTGRASKLGTEEGETGGSMEGRN